MNMYVKSKISGNLVVGDKGGMKRDAAACKAEYVCQAAMCKAYYHSLATLTALSHIIYSYLSLVNEGRF